MTSDNATPYVLMADDDAVGREMIGRFFQKAGWRYDLVEDGHQALAATERTNYDIIITDMRMPDMNGMELMRAVQRRNPAQAVIIVTASASIQDAVDFIKAGAIDFIAKPFNFDLVERAVKRAWHSTREGAAERQVLSGLVSESRNYEYTSFELSNMKMPLEIAHALHLVGRIDLNMRLRLELAFQEALTNSLDHGNLELQSSWKDEANAAGIDRYSLVKRERLSIPKYGERKIRVATGYDGDRVTITIGDGGRGFAYRPSGSFKVQDCAQCHGRGLMIIKETMDQVIYAKDGSEITMIKYLPPKD